MAEGTRPWEWPHQLRAGGLWGTPELISCIPPKGSSISAPQNQSLSSAHSGWVPAASPVLSTHGPARPSPPPTDSSLVRSNPPTVTAAPLGPSQGGARLPLPTSTHPDPSGVARGQGTEGRGRTWLVSGTFRLPSSSRPRTGQWTGQRGIPGSECQSSWEAPITVTNRATPRVGWRPPRCQGGDWRPSGGQNRAWRPLRWAEGHDWMVHPRGTHLAPGAPACPWAPTASAGESDPGEGQVAAAAGAA